jgi:hypothetical protein
MPSHWRAFEALLSVLAGLALTLLAGCTYEQEGPPEAHFEKFDAKPRKLDTVSVCPAYGCKEQTPFTFSQADTAELSALTARVPRNDNPAEERRALAYAIAWMERRVAPTVGTATDRPSMDFGGSGDPTQQDCVDEATNATSYLLVLERYELIRHHTVERPFAKDSLTPLDALGGGALPSIHRQAPWREPDGASSGKLLRARQLGRQHAAGDRLAAAAPNGNSEAPAQGADGLTGMLQRMQSPGYADTPAGSSR